MWTHPATVANVALLRERGVSVVEPASGRLTGADTGPGRLPEPEEIVAAALAAVGTAGSPAGSPAGQAAQGGDLAGRRVVVSAGGTREPLDPVRFLGNRSSGKQGYAVAAAAARRGADVTLVSANVCLPAPAGCTVVQVGTALELQDAVSAAVGSGADAVVMAAAVADFRPATYAATKIKKTHAGQDDQSAPTVELVRNPDVLAGLVRARDEAGASAPFIVGFAAETGDDTGDVLSLARAKLARKGCDLLVANEVGADKTFGQDESTVHLLRPGSEQVVTVGPAGKDVIAEAIWDAASPLLP